MKNSILLLTCNLLCIFYISRTEINIRPAQQEDLEDILELDRIVLQRMYESYGFKVYPTPDKIKQELPVDAAHIYVFYRLELDVP